MKDLSTAAASHRAARQTVIYPKKRPSPANRDGAIGKRKPSPPANRKLSPSALEAQKKRQLQALQDRLLLEEDYRPDVRAYMHEMENMTMSSASSMDQQPEIRWEMRPCLVDFLIEVHYNFRLRPEVLYLTLNIVDRYVSRRVVFTKHYQLVGCTALWIAAKFEDSKERVPTVQELAHMCRGLYDETAFVQMEGHVLATIQWVVGHPTAESWLRLACSGAGAEDARTQHIARFVMEITLYERDYIMYPPSAIACGSLVLARFIAGKPRRPYEETEMGLEIVDMLDKLLATRAHEVSDTLVKKYSFGYYSKASTVVVQFYLTGQRFVHQPLQSIAPISPMSASSVSSPCTPMSSRSFSSVGSDVDDMPATPISPTVGPDPFIVNSSGISTVYYSHHGKENRNPTPVNAMDVVMTSKLPAGRDGAASPDLVGHPTARLALLEVNTVAQSPTVR